MLRLEGLDRRPAFAWLLHEQDFATGKKSGMIDQMGTTLASATTDNTDLLAQMNASYDANDYIVQAVDSEQERIRALNSHAKRDVYKLQGQSMGTVYTEDQCKFLTLVTRLVMLASILVVAVISATSQNRISKRTGIILAVFVVLLVGVGFLILISTAATRRNNVWGHYYWKTSAAITGAAYPST